MSFNGRLLQLLAVGPRQCHRCMSSQARTSQSDDPSLIRNMAIVAHIDSGKTTLTESILHASEYISSPGSVDSGTTITDFLPAERARGITIQSASIPVRWKDWTFNLIDTPGHADFGMEVECASRVVDGAVVLLDSVQGVEPQTVGVWRQLDRYGVKSRIVFMNKLDRPGASLHSSFLSLLANRLHPKPLLLTLPIASFNLKDYDKAEPGVSGLVDLVHWKLWRWEGGAASCHQLPTSLGNLQEGALVPPGHPIIPELLKARVSLLENLSMVSDTLLETLLSLPDTESWATLPSQEILPHIRAATTNGEVLPVLCGSALKQVGTEPLMDYIGHLLAAPAGVHAPSLDPPSALQALAWKVVWDKKRGWLTFVRVYAGTLLPRQSLFNNTRNTRERIAKILMVHGDRETEVASLPPGSVGVLVGLKNTHTGDTLTNGSAEFYNRLHSVIPPPAVISVSLVPTSYSEEKQLFQAVEALVKTDPSVRMETQDGQLLIHALGSLHLEIVTSRLRDEWGASFEIGPRNVSYRETLEPSTSLTVQDTWEIENNGNAVQVEVHIHLRALLPEEKGLDSWHGNIVTLEGQPLEVTSPQSAPLMQSALANGINHVLSNSPNSGLPLSNLGIDIVNVTVPEGQPRHCATGAVASVMRDAILKNGLGPLMEPTVTMKAFVDEEHLGAVIRDLTEHGGDIVELESHSATDAPGSFPQEGLYVPPESLTPCSGSSNALASAISRARRVVCANAALADVLDYSNRLKAITGGRGVFNSVNSGYRTVGTVRRDEILKGIGKLHLR